MDLVNYNRTKLMPLSSRKAQCTYYFPTAIYILRSSSSENKFLSTLCQETLDSFKQCLEYDLQTFKEDSDSRISRILSAEGPDTASTTNEILLPPDVLLKLTALSILPSHSLRVLGKAGMRWEQGCGAEVGTGLWEQGYGNTEVHIYRVMEPRWVQGYGAEI